MQQFIIFFTFCLLRGVVSSTEMRDHADEPDGKQYSLFGETRVLLGFEEKYFFTSDNLLDFIIFPNKEENVAPWCVVILEKSMDTSSGSELSLHLHDGTNSEKVYSMPVHGVQSIKSDNIFDRHYFMVTENDNSSNVYYINTALNTFEKIIEYPSPYASDFTIWQNVFTNKIYLLMVIGNGTEEEGESRCQTKSPLYAWNEYKKVFYQEGSITSECAVAVKSFEIDNITFVATANYQDQYGDTDTFSKVYSQDGKNGKLTLHQNIMTHGALGLTHICFVSERAAEHFLILANSQGENTRSSVIYKWHDNFFVPFQSLAVSSTKLVSMMGGKGEFILLMWSLAEGLIVYQYDGWKFTRSQANFDKEMKGLVDIRVFEVNDKLLFTLIKPDEKKDTIELYIPKYEIDTTYKDIYQSVQQRSRLIESEILSVKEMEDFKGFTNEKIKGANFSLKSYISFNENSVDPIDRAKLMQFLVNNFEKGFRDLFESKERVSSLKDELEINLNMIPSDNAMQKLSVETKSPMQHMKITEAVPVDIEKLFTTIIVKDNVNENTSPEEMKATTLPGHKLPIVVCNAVERKKAVTLVSRNYLSDINLLIVHQDNTVTSHIWDPNNKRFNLEEAPQETASTINAEVELTSFSPVALYDGTGVYIEGVRKERFVGQVYQLNLKGQLVLEYKLPVTEKSVVRGMPLSMGDQCFVIVPLTETPFFFCPNRQLHGYFPCTNGTQVHVVGEGKNANILLLCGLELSVWSFNEDNKALVSNQKIKTNLGSSISASYNDGKSYVGILSGSKLSIYRKKNDRFVIWKQDFKTDIASAIINTFHHGILSIYMLRKSNNHELSPSSTTNNIINTFRHENYHFNVLQVMSQHLIIMTKYS